MPEDSLFREQRSVLAAFAARRISTCSHRKILLSLLTQVTSELYNKILQKALHANGVFKMDTQAHSWEG